MVFWLFSTMSSPEIMLTYCKSKIWNKELNFESICMNIQETAFENSVVQCMAILSPDGWLLSRPQGNNSTLKLMGNGYIQNEIPASIFFLKYNNNTRWATTGSSQLWFDSSGKRNMLKFLTISCFWKNIQLQNTHAIHKFIFIAEKCVPPTVARTWSSNRVRTVYFNSQGRILIRRDVWYKTKDYIKILKINVTVTSPSQYPTKNLRS